MTPLTLTPAQLLRVDDYIARLGASRMRETYALQYVFYLQGGGADPDRPGPIGRLLSPGEGLEIRSAIQRLIRGVEQQRLV